MKQGARQGLTGGFRGLVAAAMARDLCALIVPGADVARAHGLDLAALGLDVAVTPRHANVLLVVGPLPPKLAEAATVAFAQMPRPRAILALGNTEIAPLPKADAAGSLSQAGLKAALADLRRVFSKGAFASEVSDFDAPALHVRLQYTCPMHPEVVSDTPGDCPKCGMTLVPRETAASGHAEADAKEDTPAASAHRSHSSGDKKSVDTAHDAGADRYTCPMHPEVVSTTPGRCPKCGMTLVAAGPAAKEPDADHGSGHGGHGGHGGHAGHGGHGTAMQHGAHDAHSASQDIDGAEEHFMSMVDMTRDMPASRDGLKMEWIEVPFGPFFPGLPGGLGLTLTLDGDGIAKARAFSLLGSELEVADLTPTTFVEKMAAQSPLETVALRQLACLALEDAAGAAPDTATAKARAAAVERERIASHLGWLAGLGAQTGLIWLQRRAGGLQLAILSAQADQILRRAGTLRSFLNRIENTAMLRPKLTGIGRIAHSSALTGPVARASGVVADARIGDAVYAELGFQPLTGTGGDAMARVIQRCNEIAQSLDLIARAGTIKLPEPAVIGSISGKGIAQVETPRGAARLTVTLRDGLLESAALEVPSAAHLELAETLIDHDEIGDALVAVGSLDVSPWGMHV